MLVRGRVAAGGRGNVEWPVRGASVRFRPEGGEWDPRDGHRTDPRPCAPGTLMLPAGTLKCRLLASSTRGACGYSRRSNSRSARPIRRRISRKLGVGSATCERGGPVGRSGGGGNRPGMTATKPHGIPICSLRSGPRCMPGIVTSRRSRRGKIWAHERTVGQLASAGWGATCPSDPNPRRAGGHRLVRGGHRR